MFWKIISRSGKRSSNFWNLNLISLTGEMFIMLQTIISRSQSQK